MTEAKKKGWFSKIESREDALKVVKDASLVFFLAAGIQALLVFVAGGIVFIDVAIYAVCGFFLRRFNSRAAAVTLLILAVVVSGATLAKKMGANLGGGNNIIFALFVLWAAIRAVEATFKLHGQFASDEEAIETTHI
ncbi:MAG: hypothetical protein ACREBD_40345 [Blastocatellia bacterium]